METLISLRQALNETNHAAFQAFHIDQRPIEAEVKKLKRWLKASGGEPAPPVELLKEALLRFHRDGGTANFKDARLVCRGIGFPLGPRQLRLIDDSRLFSRLLGEVAAYSSQPRRFRRCYRGLLSSYFHLDPCTTRDDQPGCANRRRLQGFLNDHLSLVRVEGTNPDWVDIILEHRNLLADAPGARYGAAFLAGDDADFKHAATHLDISGSSWIGRSIVEAAVQAACAADDADFKRHLPHLLDLIGEPRHASLLDACLARILDRYSTSLPLTMHAGLSNFAVLHWKNPWLSINAARWRLVTEAAKKMVAVWLKLDFLKQFFELLSADGSNDTRRLDFWARYHQRIDDMYFVLGPHATSNRAPAFVDLRKKMEGRLFRLEGGGSQENNAFIMIMGPHAFVEFGAMGNAAYVYLTAALPFDLTHGNAFSSGDLKNKGRAIDRLMHKDNVRGYRTWERRFDSELFLSYGIRANDADLPEPWRSGSWLAHGNQRNIDTFCRAYGFAQEDRRSEGGQFWIKAGDEDKTASAQLRAWGFSYRGERGWVHG